MQLVIFVIYLFITFSAIYFYLYGNFPKSFSEIFHDNEIQVSSIFIMDPITKVIFILQWIKVFS